MSHTNLLVLSQDAAKQFYTEKLGFEVRTDMVADGFRFLSVGPKEQPDVSVILTEPQPPMFDPESSAQLRALVAKGAMSGGVMATNDCRATYQTLKDAGVAFLQEPTERMWGIEALFRDDSGNWWSLTEERGPGA